MTKKNWYGIVLVFAICIVYRESCAPDRDPTDASGRFTIIDDFIADIRDDDGRCL